MKISIITAVYNREATIASAINSIALQTHSDLEWIVIDGGSTDQTLTHIRHATRQPDLLVSEPDDGIYDALNKGLAVATGDVVGFLRRKECECVGSFCRGRRCYSL